jgi:hypothetical protein
MPHNGVSSEWTQAREDEIARFLTAREQVERLRTLGNVLALRHSITPAYHADYDDTLDFILAALLVGKRNTAMLRGCGHE